MSEQTLKPCPFCGSDTAPTLIMRSVSSHVECTRPSAGGCGTRGPYKSFPHEAIAAWNKRADQSKDIDARIEQARLAEREACAAVCEAISTGLSAYRDGYGASACLEAIRARTRP